MSKSSKKSKQKDQPSRSGKEERLFQNLLKLIEQFMGGKGFSSMTEFELMKRLSLPDQHLELFREALHSLTERELVEEHPGGRYAWKKTNQDLVTGIIKMHPRGFGFVHPENTPLLTQDIFIPKHLTKNAVDGDTVEVEINNEVYSEKGPEGKVVAILSRARTHMAGIVNFIDDHGDIYAYAPLLGSQQRILVKMPESEEKPLRVGDRIVMEVISWGNKEDETVCRLSHTIGNIDDPSCDIEAAIEEFEIRSDFPSKVTEEAERFGTTVGKGDLRSRQDLRQLEIFTIDPDTAKDYDDALNVSKDENGHYHLGVHIADVSHYVKTGTALDIEAQERGNSTYFPGRSVPMLPRALSDNLCSLKPGVIRLTVSVSMHFDASGELIEHKIFRSYIKSAKRFTYKEAKQVLDGEKESPHKPTLELMVELCHLLKKKRYDRGSVEFALPELAILVNDKGVPTHTDYITYDITHQMVEEFMLKANELVAWDLSEKGKNLTYRVHGEPAEDHLKDFSTLAAAFGFKVPTSPEPRDIQRLFEEAGDTPYNNYLAASYIRRMRLALYSAENIGHYGLSLTHYCHFTSPIRRYIDLVVHRILFGDSDDLQYLQYISSHCSEQERMSAKAENSVVLLKKLRLLKTFQEQDPYREYEAIVTRVKNFGFHFEINDLMLEGFLHIAELEEDYFVFEERLMRLRGTRKGSTYASGDTITVMLKEVDFISAETKWYLTSKKQSTHPISEEKTKKHKKRAPVKKKAKQKKKTTSSKKRKK